MLDIPKSITDLPFPPIKQGFKSFVLPYDLWLEQWIVPQGTPITIGQSHNFGIVVLHKDCQDKRKFTIPRRIFRY